MVLERLLLADVGRARNQDIAAADADRPVAGEESLLDPAVVEAFLGDGRAAGMQGVASQVAAPVQLRRPRRGAIRDPELGCSGIVDDQKVAARVLDRDARRQQPEHLPQQAEFGAGRAEVFGRCVGPEVVSGMALHAGIVIGSLLVLVKRSVETRDLPSRHVSPAYRPAICH